MNIAAQLAPFLPRHLSAARGAAVGGKLRRTRRWRRALLRAGAVTATALLMRSLPHLLRPGINAPVGRRRLLLSLRRNVGCQ